MKLSLKNVGVHKELELELSRINILTGPNRSGKSTIGTVLSYLLTGRLPFGGEPEVLISEGAEKAEVTLSLPEGGVRVEISKDEGASVVFYRNGQKFEGEKAHELLRKFFAIPTPFSARLFTSNISVRAVGPVVEKALHVKFTVPALFERISELEPELREHELVKKLLDGSLTVRSAKQLLQRRREKIREELERLEEELIPESVKVNGKLVNLEKTDLEKAKNRLKELEKERTELLAKLEKKKELELELEKIERIIQQKNEFERFRKLLTKREQTKAQFKLLKDRLELFSELQKSKKCPLLGGACAVLENTQGAEHGFENYAFEMLRELEDKRLELIEVSRELDALKKAFSVAEVPDKAQKRAEEISELLQEHFQDVSPQKLAELDQRIETGKKLIELLESYQNQAEKRKKQEELKKELEATEKLLEFLQRTQLPSGNTEFEKNLKELLEVFGLSSKVRLENTKVELQGVLSRSEYVLTQAALKLALSRSTGGGLLVMDDLDVLDQKSRALLLKEAYKTGCFSLLISSSSTPPQKSSKPDIKTIFLGQKTAGKLDEAGQNPAHSIPAGNLF